MEPCAENCEHKAKSDRRLSLLADRLAIALVVLKQRYGTDWEPWFGESIWEDAEHLGDEVRQWPEYKEAKGIVKIFIKRMEREHEQARKEEAQRRDAEAARGADASTGGGVGQG